MAKKPDWTFPDLPPFLARLTLEHLPRLRAFIRRHGKLVGASPRGEVHALLAREPVSVFLTVLGSTDDAPLMVVTPDKPPAEDLVSIALVPGDDAKVIWSPKIALDDVLLCLEADEVVKTSQLKKSSKDGLN